MIFLFQRWFRIQPYTRPSPPCYLPLNRQVLFLSQRWQTPLVVGINQQDVGDPSAPVPPDLHLPAMAKYGWAQPPLAQVSPPPLTLLSLPLVLGKETLPLFWSPGRSIRPPVLVLILLLLVLFLFQLLLVLFHLMLAPFLFAPFLSLRQQTPPLLLILFLPQSGLTLSLVLFLSSSGSVQSRVLF
ncbi:hypothetical protein Q8A73_018796 [Channa argus]|nr:hypothetical protein Q8A73_018796 [Channa argus]